MLRWIRLIHKEGGRRNEDPQNTMKMFKPESLLTLLHSRLLAINLLNRAKQMQMQSHLLQPCEDLRDGVGLMTIEEALSGLATIRLVFFR